MKKDLIATHALEVFARDGYHNAKVKTIAEEAGIAVGTIYIFQKHKVCCWCKYIGKAA